MIFAIGHGTWVKGREIPGVLKQFRRVCPTFLPHSATVTLYETDDTDSWVADNGNLVCPNGAEANVVGIWPVYVPPHLRR